MSRKSVQQLFQDLRSKNKAEGERLQNSIATNWMEFRESLKPNNVYRQIKNAAFNHWLKSPQKRNDFILTIMADLISISANNIKSFKTNMAGIFKNAFSAKK